MLFRFVDFKGEIPRIHPRLLPADAAQAAINTRIETGALVPMNAPSVSFVLPAPAQSIYLRTAGSLWFSWPGIVNAQPGPVANLRTYITGDGVPKVVGNITLGQSYNLALNRPVDPLVAVPVGTPDPDTSEHVLFTYTFVTNMHEESQPADLSNEVLIDPTQHVTLSGWPTDAEIALMNRGIDSIRFYRSQTDTFGVTSLLFVVERTLVMLGPTLDYNPNTMRTAEVCPSVDYNTPVDDLQGIISAPNGMMVAFSDKTIYFCEPYHPHAWPVKYSQSVDFTIVGLASIGSSIIVMTTGTPYILQGTHPDSMRQEKIEKNLPCLSARGIVDLGYAVAYPSTEGLVVVTPASVDVVTKSLFTRSQWDAMAPETFVAGQYNGRYIFAYTPAPGRTRVGILDLSGETPYFTRSDDVFEAVYFSIGSGKLFILTGGSTIMEWDDLDAPKRSQTWQSRLLSLPGPTSFGCVLVETDDYDETESLELDVFADGQLLYTSTARNEPDRLPSGTEATRWSVRFRGTARVTSISLCHSPSELAQS